MTSTDSSNVPALSPPPGMIPNFENPQTQTPVFVATAVLCISFATAALVVRLTTSLHGPQKSFRVEDFTCLTAWAGLLTTCIFTVYEIRDGLGRHQWDMRASDMVPLARLFYINRLFYSPAILAAKLTILLQLMRIFVPTKSGIVYWLILGLIWGNVCFYTANLLSVIFQCHPIPKAWESSIPGKCDNPNLNLLVTGSINVVSDILMLLLPLWTIWHMKLPIRAKVNVSIAFGAGIFATIAAMMRLVYSVKIVEGTDLSFLRIQHAMWTIAEITTAIICGSQPLVPQFIGFFRAPGAIPRPTIISSGSKSQPRSESTGTLRGSHSIELGLRAPRSSTDVIDWKGGETGSGGGYREEREAVMTATYVPTDEEYGTAWYGETEEADAGIRKTTSIEQHW